MDVKPVALMFKALSDETRLRITALLSLGELCVCHLERALDLPQPNISRHLAVLRGAGMVEDRRVGNWVYYRLAPQSLPICREAVAPLIAWFANQPKLEREVARVLKACGPGLCT
jgi:ArsR family transcriptional regulator, arsenate/arsenite/antimonite-responsive transcriptional repressor